MTSRRNTIQKDLVRNTVYEMRRHVTANEVYEFIKEAYPTIGKGTVYRNLDIILMELNLWIMIFHLKAFVPNVGRRNRMNRKAMYKLSYGLFILTAKEAEKDNGCIINTAIQAASEPN